MSYAFSIIGREDGTSYLTVYVPGRDPISVANDHPNHDEIVRRLRADDLTDEELVALADISEGVKIAFERITTRVVVRNGAVYFDGDEVHDSITDAIVRALEQDTDEDTWIALALFLEKVAANPQAHSREQLYDWLAAHRFTLTPDGDIVAHKGMRVRDEGYVPSYGHGKVIVNGEPFDSCHERPVKPNDTVELPRSEVDHDPSSSCSVGLHVGTPEYAAQYGDVVLVRVNPRDVVSVPTDAGGEKVRVCRYTLIGPLDEIDLEDGAVVLPEAAPDAVSPLEAEIVGPLRSDHDD